jgi:hypothetical protein
MDVYCGSAGPVFEIDRFYVGPSTRPVAARVFDRSFAGCHVHVQHLEHGIHNLVIAINLWIVFVLLAAYPFWCLVRRPRFSARDVARTCRYKRRRVTVWRVTGFTGVHVMACCLLLQLVTVIDPEHGLEPLGWILVFAVLFPAPLWGGLWAWLHVRRYNRLRPPWSCSNCGYDLTGNASGTCPECGTCIVAEGKKVSG